MKRVAAIISGLMMLLSPFCFAAEKPLMKDQKDKESYSLGYETGRSMKRQGLAINADVYAAAFKDALQGNTPLLTQDEMTKHVDGVRNRIMVAYKREMQKIAEKNLIEGKAYLEVNKKKEGVTTLPSGLQYKVLVPGKGRSPLATSEVTVNYRGTLINGTEFDSSYRRSEAATFKLNGVIRGWTEALQLMKEGAKWQLWIPPNLAYGDRELGIIPPNSTLIFEVELISFK